MLTRRQLLNRGAIGGAGLLLYRLPPSVAAPPVLGGSPRLRRWVDPLPVPPVLDGRGGGKSFTIAARESSSWQFHPSLPPTRTWGYWADSAGMPYLGPTIVATRRPNDTVETAVTVTWRNELDAAFLPNDSSLPGAVQPGDPVPIVTHLHGGENHPQFDGTPLQWFTKGRARGPHYITDTFTYYNEQRASMVWYHDHALGNTRTNVYAGLAGVYLIRDELDTGEPGNPLGLPAGPYEIPLVLQDKTFNPDGSLFSPTHGVTAYHDEWVPEFFGDVAVVNAKAWPQLVNTTADTHPIHLHLVTFEVIDRRPFDVDSYDPDTKAISYTGPAAPAPPTENGRKDTVQAHPGQVTRIRARFELPDEGTIQLPPGVDNAQYVWHCHILEHEENDMMRAFEVVSPG